MVDAFAAARPGAKAASAANAAIADLFPSAAKSAME
jgi:hypothetical protein